MHCTGFHHIGLNVTDMEKSIAFYRALGAKITRSFPMGTTGKTIYMLSFGSGAVVELLPTNPSEKESSARWAHLALDVKDCREAYARAIAAGASTRTAPQDCCLAGIPVCNAFVFGPDGEIIEFFEEKK